MENEIQDLMASLKTKLLKDPSYQALADKAEQKLNLMVAFMKDSRTKMAQWEELPVNDDVPDKVLEDLESLISEQVGYNEGGKIAKQKIRAVL